MAAPHLAMNPHEHTSMTMNPPTTTGELPLRAPPSTPPSFFFISLLPEDPGHIARGAETGGEAACGDEDAAGGEAEEVWVERPRV